MDLQTIQTELARLVTKRKAAVGELDQRLRVLETSRAVLAAPYDEQIDMLKAQLTALLTEDGRILPRLTIKAEGYTYTFSYRETVDMDLLRAMVQEVPQVAQCLVRKATGTLRLK